MEFRRRAKARALKERRERKGTDVLQRQTAA